jgi:hypothetical protein
MSNAMVQLQEATIKAQCKQLRMPVVSAQFRSVAEQAVREKKSHIGYLEALLAAELEERERNTIARRIKEAHLPRVWEPYLDVVERCGAKLFVMENVRELYRSEELLQIDRRARRMRLSRSKLKRTASN